MRTSTGRQIRPELPCSYPSARGARMRRSPATLTADPRRTRGSDVEIRIRSPPPYRTQHHRPGRSRNSCGTTAKTPRARRRRPVRLVPGSPAATRSRRPRGSRPGGSRRRSGAASVTPIHHDPAEGGDQDVEAHPVDGGHARTRRWLERPRFPSVPPADLISGTFNGTSSDHPLRSQGRSSNLPPRAGLGAGPIALPSRYETAIRRIDGPATSPRGPLPGVVIRSRIPIETMRSPPSRGR